MPRRTDGGDVFDGVVDSYDAYRPGFPTDVFYDIGEITGLGSGSRVLEVGPGTGLATARLVDLSVDVLGVERGTALAGAVTERFAGTGQVRVDDASSSDGLFESPILRWHRQTQHLDARGFVGLLRTWSLYGSLPDHVREPLLDDIETRIRTRMGDRARRDYLVVSRLARRADPAGEAVG